ncbi:MAG: hypothetical protein AAF549_00205 [Pseudomonadota bacterium]
MAKRKSKQPHPDQLAFNFEAATEPSKDEGIPAPEETVVVKTSVPDQLEPEEDTTAAAFQAEAKAPVSGDVMTADETRPQNANIIDVDTSDKESVQQFLHKVSQGRFGDLEVSFDGGDPQLVRSCLVNLNDPDAAYHFVKAIDDDKRADITGETISFATPLIFITHHTVSQSLKAHEPMVHFKTFAMAPEDQEPIRIGSSLLNCRTTPGLDNNNFSSVVLVRDMQLSKEQPDLPQDGVYYYLGLNALHEQREVVLAKTRDMGRRQVQEFVQIPQIQPRLM